MLSRIFRPFITRTPRHYFSTVLDNDQTEVAKPSISETHQIKYKIDFDNLNLEDYRDLSSKIKQSTGYSLLDVEPFPRMKIMKLGLIILNELKEKIPEKAMYRIYMGKFSRLCVTVYLYFFGI